MIKMTKAQTGFNSVTCKLCNTYMPELTRLLLILEVACRVFGSEPLVELMRNCCQFDHREQFSVTFESKCKTARNLCWTLLLPMFWTKLVKWALPFLSGCCIWCACSFRLTTLKPRLNDHHEICPLAINYQHANTVSDNGHAPFKRHDGIG